MPDRAGRAAQGIDGIADVIAGLPVCEPGAVWNAAHNCFVFRLRMGDGWPAARGVLYSDGALSLTTADDVHDEESSQRFVEFLRPRLGEAGDVLRARDLHLNGVPQTAHSRRTTMREAITEAQRSLRGEGVAATTVIGGASLQARAHAALPRWLCADPVPGLYEALLPDEVLGQIEEEHARTVARGLRGVGQSSSFIARWQRVRTAQNLVVSDIADNAEGAPAPAEAEALLRPVLRHLWPEWEGWAAPAPRAHTMEEYVYDLQTGRFWDRELCRPIADKALDAAIWKHAWPVVDVNGRETLVAPSRWMKSREVGYVVESVAHVPGAERIVPDVLFDATGRQFRPGLRMLNTWRAGPAVELDAPNAGPWLDLAWRMFEGRALPEMGGRAELYGAMKAVLDRFAWIVQHPGHPLPGVIALLGPQGVGKDALLQPLARAVGWWNTANITPDELVGRFNPFVEADLVIVNEARVVHRDGGAHQFYSRLKSLSTRPPDTIARDEKNIPVRYVPKTASHIITSNEITSLFIPDDDRRYFSPDIRLKAGWHIAAGLPAYFTNYFRWLNQHRGYAAVHRFLAERNLSHFDPSAPPPSSATKQRAQEASAEGDSALVWAIEKLGNPDAFFEAELREIADGVSRHPGTENPELKLALRSAPQLARKMEELGYQVVPRAGRREWEVKVPVGQGDVQMFVRKQSRKAYVRTERAGGRRGHIVGWLLKRMKAWAKNEELPNRMPDEPLLPTREEEEAEP
jgi:hypothetical protein